MNNDGCVEIKQVERIFNSPGILYVDAYQRKRYEQTEDDRRRPPLLREQQTAMDQMRRDFTKPIWSCKMKFAPNFVCGVASSDDPEPLQKINELLRRFAERLKNEQQDESSLRINLDIKDNAESKSKIKENVQWLVQKLILVVRKQRFNAEKERDQKQEQEKLERGRKPQTQKDIERVEIYHRETEKFDKYFIELLTRINMESLTRFVSLFDSYLCRTQDSETTSTLFAVMPKIGYLSLAVHPILLAIYLNLKQQVLAEEERRKSSNKANVPPNKQENKQDNRFPQNKMPSSRILFINLDGFESEFNIDIARTFNSRLMYVSFPRDWKCDQKRQGEQEVETSEEDFRREVYYRRMLRKYYMGNPADSEKLLTKIYQANPKDVNKNIFVMPVYSERMNQHIQQQSETTDKSKGSIQQYESNFIYYIFKELLCSQISDFNPSLVVVSYSGKLNLEDRHFIEMMKQLTKLGNYKVMFFPNLIKSYMFEGDMSEDQEFFQNMYMQAEQSICLHFPDDSINLDMLEKMSIFLKVSSGTYNLSQLYEQESFLEKYRNGKILGYVSDLMDQLKKEYDTIKKVHFRSGELVAIAKVINKSFEEQKYSELLKSTVGSYHTDLLNSVRGLLEDDSPESHFEQLSFVHKTYPPGQLVNICDSFEFEYKLEVAMQKFYKRTYFTLRRPGEAIGAKQHRTLPTLMSPQFEIIDGEQTHQLDVSPSNRLLYDRENRNNLEEPLIYLTNVLFKFKGRESEEFCNFVGKIKKNDNRVQLRRVTLEKSDEQKYAIFTNWNYHQTRDFIYWYWPQRFDMKSWMLMSIAGRSYTPKIENLVFRASIDKPEYFFPLKVRQNADRATLPRYGCASYSIVVGGQTHLYIFGGFYRNEENYLRFQNNVDRFTVENGSATDITITNVSKGKKVDAVRPRTYYDIIELESTDRVRNIALLGGYGKNFSRPYCAMSSVWYRVSLNLTNPDDVQVARQLSKQYQINVPRPVRARGVTKLQVLVDDETRMLKEQSINSDGYTFFHYTYEIKGETVEAKRQFEFGLIQHQIYREEVDEMRKSPQENSAEDTRLRFHRNPRSYNNIITLFIENTPYVFELKLELSHEVKAKHSSIQEAVHIPSHSIISLSSFQTVIYALLRDPVFTLDKCVLAEFNVSTINNVVISESDQVIKMQEMHRFRTNFRNNALVVLKSKQIAVLHGPKHSLKGKAPAQFILKKTRTINETLVKESSFRLQPVPILGTFKPLLSATAFLKIADAVHCYSFASNGSTQLQYMHLQMSLVERQYQWQLVYQGVYKFQLELPNNSTLAEYLVEYRLNHITLLDVKLAEKVADKAEQSQKNFSPSEIVVKIGLRGRKYEVRPLMEKQQPLEFKLIGSMELQGEQPMEQIQPPAEGEKEPIVLDKTWQFWEEVMPAGQEFI